MRYRNALITGATSGIGRALAYEYARPGVTLALCGRDAGRLADVAGTCRDAGAAVNSRVVDVTEAAALRTWIEAADAAAPLDLIIANAGISGGSAAGGEDADAARRLGVSRSAVSKAWFRNRELRRRVNRVEHAAFG